VARRASVVVAPCKSGLARVLGPMATASTAKKKGKKWVPVPPDEVGEMAQQLIQVGSTVYDAVRAFVKIIVPTPTRRPLATVAMIVSADAGIVRLVAGYLIECDKDHDDPYGDESHECCAYERDGFEIDLELEPQDREDLDQEIGIDLELDDLRGLRARELVARFLPEIGRIERWDLIGDAVVKEVWLREGCSFALDGETYIPAQGERDDDPKRATARRQKRAAGS
jgi:hypothetical protein